MPPASPDRVPLQARPHSCRAVCRRRARGARRGPCGSRSQPFAARPYSKRAEHPGRENDGRAGNSPARRHSSRRSAGPRCATAARPRLRRAARDLPRAGRSPQYAMSVPTIAAPAASTRLRSVTAGRSATARRRATAPGDSGPAHRRPCEPQISDVGARKRQRARDAEQHQRVAGIQQPPVAGVRNERRCRAKRRFRTPFARGHRGARTRRA